MSCAGHPLGLVTSPPADVRVAPPRKRHAVTAYTPPGGRPPCRSSRRRWPRRTCCAPSTTPVGCTRRRSTGQAELVIETARAKRLPTIFQDRESVVKGALASYGESYYTIGRLSAKRVQRVLLGADPGGLPVEQLDKVHFVINLKTAKALGLTIPPSMMGRADQVIE
jgi:hypothetical protein